MATTFATTFDPTNPAHRTVQRWRDGAYTYTLTAPAYARAHGEAKVMLADGSVKRYWIDGEPDALAKVHSRTYTKVHMGEPLIIPKEYDLSQLPQLGWLQITEVGEENIYFTLADTSTGLCKVLA